MLDLSLFSTEDADRLSQMMAARRECEGVKKLFCFYFRVDKMPRDYVGYLSWSSCGRRVR